MKIGILGGSFNPIHHGHLILAENVRQEAGLDKVLIMPAHASPFKLNRKIAPGEDRFRMVQLAVEDNEHLEASDFESASDRISYTADTMRMLEEIYPEDQLFFITGADSILEIEGLRRASSPLSVSRGRTPGLPGR